MLSFALDLVGDLINGIVMATNWIGAQFGMGSSHLSSNGLSG